MLVYFTKIRRAVYCYRLMFLYCLMKLSLISTRCIIAKMCFDCMLHLSVCFFVNMYALVHI